MTSTFLLVAIFASTSASAVEIISRAEWGAQNAISKRADPIEIVPTGNNRVAAENIMTPLGDVKYLTVHHSGTPSKTKPISKHMSDFQKLMFSYNIDYNNGVKKDIYLGDVPYHFLINRKGEVAEGRELLYAAYSNTVYKTPIEEHVTVVLDGNFDVEVPSKEQISSLTSLLADLSEKFNVQISNIGVHNDVAQTSCPGENLEKLMPAVIRSLK